MSAARVGRFSGWSARWRALVAARRGGRTFCPPAVAVAHCGDRGGVRVRVRAGLVTVSDGVGSPVEIRGREMSVTGLGLLLSMASTGSDASDVVARWRTGLPLLSLSSNPVEEV